MAMVSASAFGSSVRLRIKHPVFLSPLLTPPPAVVKMPTRSSCYHFALTTRTRRSLLGSSKNFVVKEELPGAVVDADEELKLADNNQTLLYSFSPLPLLFAAALLPGAGAVRSVFGPFVEIVRSWNLPDWLVHWGHPGNMV